MAKKSSKSAAEVKKAFKAKINEAKKIWNNPKRSKNIKRFSDAVKAAYKK